MKEIRCCCGGGNFTVCHTSRPALTTRPGHREGRKVMFRTQREVARSLRWSRRQFGLPTGGGDRLGLDASHHDRRLDGGRAIPGGALPSSGDGWDTTFASLMMHPVSCHQVKQTSIVTTRRRHHSFSAALFLSAESVLSLLEARVGKRRCSQNPRLYLRGASPPATP